MKKIITILLLLVSLVSFSQEYQTNIKLDSLIWIKINEYRASDSAILYGDVPNVITVFALGEWREFAYDLTIKHSKMKIVRGYNHTDPKELASRGITGENLSQHWFRIDKTDLTDESTLDRIATEIVTGWINSWTHRIVLNWLGDKESCVVTVMTKQPMFSDPGVEDYFYKINAMYQTK